MVRNSEAIGGSGDIAFAAMAVSGSDVVAWIEGDRSFI